MNAAYPGSPRGTVKWKFPRENTDLLNFQVTVKTDGRDPVTTEAAATHREDEINGLRPSAGHIVTVEAVYKDNKRIENSVEFSSEGTHTTNPCVSKICICY